MSRVIKSNLLGTKLTEFYLGQARVLASGLSAARDLTIPDLSGVLGLSAAALTGSRALVSDSSGLLAVSTVTAAELALLSGVSSSIQTQLNNKQPLDGDLTALAGLTGTGFGVRTATDTWALRTLTGTANQVNISNPAGIAGNPTFSLPQDIHTTATPSFATVYTTQSVGGSCFVATQNSGAYFLGLSILSNSGISIVQHQGYTMEHRFANLAAGTDAKQWRYSSYGDFFSLDLINDAYTAASSAYTIYRSGYTPSRVEFGCFTTGPGKRYVKADYTKVNTTLAADSDLAENLLAGETYSFEYLIFYDPSLGGAKFGISGSATATNLIAEVNLTGGYLGRITAMAGSQSTSLGTSGTARIAGTMTVNAAGSFGPSVAEMTTNAGVTIHRGSSGRIWRNKN